MRAKSWALLDQLAVSGGNFLTIAICANILNLEEQGKWMYSYIYYLFLLVLNISLVFQAAQVLMPRSRDPESYRSKLFYLQLSIALVGTLGVLLLPLVLAGDIGDTRTNSELLALGLFLLVQQLTDYVRRMEHVCGSTFVAAFGSVTVYGARILALVLLSPKSSVEALWICAISAVPPIVIHLKNNAKQYVKYFSIYALLDIKEHLRFSKNLFGTALFSWVWSFFPIFMLGSLQGATSVAILASIRSMTNVANVVMEYIEVSLITPLAYRVSSEGNKTLRPIIRKIMVVGSVIFGVGASVIIAVGDDLLGFVLGNVYSEYESLLLIVWISYAIYFIGRIQAIGYRIGLNSRVELIGSFFSASAALVCAYPMIKWFGIEGAALTYLAVALTGLLAQVSNTHFQKVLE